MQTRTVPHGFSNYVIEKVGGKNPISKQLVHMVRKGKRRNDLVLMAIIEVDHNWKELEHERLKKML